MDGRRDRGATLLRVAAFAAAVALAVLAHGSARDALRTPYFVTGWCTLGLVGWLVARSWRRAPEGRALPPRARVQLAATGVLVVAFALHVDLRVPDGLFDLVLTALLAALVLSAAGVARLAHAARRDEPEPSERTARLERRLLVHTALVHALLALSVVHGSLVHLHGWLAPLVQEG